MDFDLHIFKSMGGITEITDPSILDDKPMTRNIFWPRKFELMLLHDLKTLLSYTRTKFIKFYRNIVCDNYSFNDNNDIFWKEMKDLILWYDFEYVENMIYEMYKKVSLAKINPQFKSISGDIRNNIFLPTRHKLMILCCKVNKIITLYGDCRTDFFEGWKLCDDITREIAFENEIISDGHFDESIIYDVKSENILQQELTNNANNATNNATNNNNENNEKRINNELNKLLVLIDEYSKPKKNIIIEPENNYQCFEQIDYWNWRDY